MYFSSFSDSDQPPGEMLLKSGTRLPKNDRLTQSAGELDVTSTYLAKGPQRDCSTLPSHHRPPSYEEASKQKDRIMMTEPRPSRSTGGRQRQRQRPLEERCLSLFTTFMYILSVQPFMQLSLPGPLYFIAT